MRRAAGRLFRLHRSSLGYNSHIKVQWGILLLFSPQYNNIIPKKQELVKVNDTIVEISRNYKELVGIPSNLCAFATFAPLELGFTDAAAASRI